MELDMSRKGGGHFTKALNMKPTNVKLCNKEYVVGCEDKLTSIEFEKEINLKLIGLGLERLPYNTISYEVDGKEEIAELDGLFRLPSGGLLVVESKRSGGAGESAAGIAQLRYSSKLLKVIGYIPVGMLITPTRISLFSFDEYGMNTVSHLNWVERYKRLICVTNRKTIFTDLSFFKNSVYLAGLRDNDRVL